MDVLINKYHYICSLETSLAIDYEKGGIRICHILH